MNLIDLLIIILAIGALYRGRDAGSVRQVCSTIGFFGGLLLGSWVSPKFVNLSHTQLSRSLLTLSITLVLAVIGLGIADYFGELLKNKIRLHKIDLVDRGLGSVIGLLTLLVTVWLGAAILVKLPFVSLQNALHNSGIVSFLEQSLPKAPTIVSDLGHVINPNGFPVVFTGNEPTPTTTSTNLPSLASLAGVIHQDEDSVVKIEGRGCGGIVEGSGFIAASNTIITNAHVIAGISHPYVVDFNGNTYSATPVWFDPNLDLAVLKVSNLNLPSLNISDQTINNGTAGAVLGYPGGGSFTADPAVVTQEFTATGRNIYNQGNTIRDIYEINAEVVPGNSGGPLINTSGQVIGIVFAQSTVYNHVGYALTTNETSTEISQAISSTTVSSTGNTCAE